MALVLGCSAPAAHRVDGDTAHQTTAGEAAEGPAESAPADQVGGAGGASATQPPQPCSSESAPPAPLRRLTRREYRNTVRDLLGVSEVAIDLPADPVAGGFDTNAAALSISPLLAEKYLQAAEALAQASLVHLPQLMSECDVVEAGEQTCARQLVEQLGRRAYRRPLTEDEIERLLRAFAAGRDGGTFHDGARLVIETLLQAPAFLYRFEVGEPAQAEGERVPLTQYELASRLSFLLWGSMPSDELLDAAAAGELAAPEQLADWARRMLDDPRARPQLSEFYRQWLGVGDLAHLHKDELAYPELDQELREAMAAELPAFVEHVLWSADHRLETLLTAPLGFVTPPLAKLYGVEVDSGQQPALVELDPAERRGVLTQAAVLAVHALPDQSSPVSRGKLVREKLLCQPPPPPPPSVNTTPPELDASQSTRERFAAHTANPTCAGCHQLMDPIGFTFESYDALGRFRDSEDGIPIDTSGWIVGSEDVDGDLQDATELVTRLAASRQVQDCVASQWFRFAFGRPEAEADACALRDVQQAFADSSGDLLELLISFTQTSSFRYRQAVEHQEETP